MAELSSEQPNNVWRQAASTAQIQFVNQLKNKRAQQVTMKRQEEERFRSIRTRIQAPRRFIYYPLIYIAVVADIVGLLNVTGIGAIAVFLINLVLSVFFFVVSLWLGRTIRRVHGAGDQVVALVKNLEQRITVYRQQLAAAVRLARSTTAGRRLLRSTIGRRAVGITAKVAKATRAPMIRSIAAYILELVPFINMVPWYTLNMVLTYRDHQKEYEQSLALTQEYQPVSSEEVNAFRELEQVKASEFTDTLQQTASRVRQTTESVVA